MEPLDEIHPELADDAKGLLVLDALGDDGEVERMGEVDGGARYASDE